MTHIACEITSRTGSTLTGRQKCPGGYGKERDGPQEAWVQFLPAPRSVPQPPSELKLPVSRPGAWSRKISLTQVPRLGEHRDLGYFLCRFIRKIFQSSFSRWNYTEGALSQDDHLEQNAWALLKHRRACSPRRPRGPCDLGSGGGGGCGSDSWFFVLKYGFGL